MSDLLPLGIEKTILGIVIEPAVAKGMQRLLSCHFYHRVVTREMLGCGKG